MEDRKRHIAIFTTASLPWMTGTSVNPLFRAAYLAKDGSNDVTLVLPWLSLENQKLVFPSNVAFMSPAEQEMYIRNWLKERVPEATDLTIRFYPGKFAVDMRSIFPVGDISDVIDNEEADVAVLEEPEHLTWFHHGKRWKTKFRLVIGVIHTNYVEYARREKNGMFKSLALKYLNSWVVGIYCHKVIRLSGATQNYPDSIICNIHGVNPRFLEIGLNTEDSQNQTSSGFTKGAYYIGKMIWSKGYKELLKLIRENQKDLSVSGFEIDLYGSGEDTNEVQTESKKLEIPVRVYPGRDHANPIFHQYKVFVNPSTSDVVCTTTAEALAMGKIVVCANHPSNEFFKQFPNCWIYNTSKEFVEVICKALKEEPLKLSSCERHELSWEAATERFLKVAAIDTPIPLTKLPSKNFAAVSFNVRRNMENASAYLHFVASGFQAPRRAFGAVPCKLQPEEKQCKEHGDSVPVRSQSLKYS